MKKTTTKIFCLTDTLDNTKDNLMVIDNSLENDEIESLITDYFASDERLIELYENDKLQSFAKLCVNGEVVSLDDCEYYIEEIQKYYK